MKKIKVFHRTHSLLEVIMKNASNREYGVNRNRDPDAGWGEVVQTDMDYCQELDMTPELKLTLLEDLAYVYGSNTKKFRSKLKQFKLVPTETTNNLIEVEWTKINSKDDLPKIKGNYLVTTVDNNIETCYVDGDISSLKNTSDSWIRHFSHYYLIKVKLPNN